MAEAGLMRGAPVARAISEDVSRRADLLAGRGVRPTLAIVRVGEREDDLAYERSAIRRAESHGVHVVSCALDATCDEAELIGAIDRINGDDTIHGCLIFRPLPAHIDEGRVVASLHAEKDVDGATPGSLLGVFTGDGTGFAPCTAEAVIEILDHYGVELAGADVTVVGRSLVIGRPVSMLLQARDATVTMCHTKTRDLATCCRRADVLVACAGHACCVGTDCTNLSQVVVDVGINWDEERQAIVGDVDPAVASVAAALTPVPGGVGAVTTAVLMRHVVEAAERQVR